MIKNKTRHLRIGVLRTITMLIGGSLIVVGLGADWFGISRTGNFGAGQILALSAGILVLLLGSKGQWAAARFGLLVSSSTGRSIATRYRGVALLFLNTLILLACLELGAKILVTQLVLSGGEHIPSYFHSQDWGTEYWQEQRLLEGNYQPYVIWRRAPFKGATINIEQDGIRHTPGADCGADSYKVFAFGGSTMWGYGVPDWGTVPAYLQAGLESQKDEPVCVVNFGQIGFVSTQSVIELLAQLQSGNTPDLAIFYSGVNDVYTAYQFGLAGVHWDLDAIGARFEERQNPLTALVKASSSFQLIRFLIAKQSVAMQRLERRQTTSDAILLERTYQTMGIDSVGLAESVAQIYLNNYKIVGALAQEYGLKFSFFWQPIVSIGEKSLTLQEARTRSEMDPALVHLYDEVYRRVEKAAKAPQYEHLYYIAHIFDGQDSQVYVDFHHVTPVGNHSIAQEMLREIVNQ